MYTNMCIYYTVRIMYTCILCACVWVCLCGHMLMEPPRPIRVASISARLRSRPVGGRMGLVREQTRWNRSWDIIKSELH